MQHPTVKIPYYITEEILKVGRHTRVTAAGRVFSFSVLIMMGCGKGTAGLGYGRGPTIPQVFFLDLCFIFLSYKIGN